MRIRLATELDMKVYFQWANEPSVRQVAFHSDPNWR